MSLEATPAVADGVRLLSHRPSVMFKLERHATEPGSGDPAEDGVVVAGPAWDERLRDALASLCAAERAQLLAVRLDDPEGLPLPAATLLARERTDWFPKFLSQGRMEPVFQPLVDLRAGAVHGREAQARGRLGRVEVRGAELLAAAEAHDALYSFDARARVAALEAGLPRLPAGERLFVKLDPRGVLDVASSLRSVWPVVEALGAHPSSVVLELIGADRHPDLELLTGLVAAHRERGAAIAVDDLGTGTAALEVFDALRPDVAKLAPGLCKAAATSPARRALVAALVKVAHEQRCRVVATGIEVDADLEQAQALGADLGQGFFLGQPTEQMLPVDPRLVSRGRPVAPA